MNEEPLSQLILQIVVSWLPIVVSLSVMWLAARGIARQVRNLVSVMSDIRDHLAAAAVAETRAPGGAAPAPIVPRSP